MNKYRWFHILSGWIIARYLKLVWVTSQWVFVNDDVKERIKGQGAIILLWHGRFLSHPSIWKFDSKEAATFLVSKSEEGNFVAQIALNAGMKVVRGSTTNPKKKNKRKGGIGATKKFLKLLKSGQNIGLTPDGPRGPLMRLGEGPIKLAQLSGAPILLVCWSMNRQKFLNSWDRFVFPFPFGRGNVEWASEPIYVERTACVETARQDIERRLVEVTQNCDIRAGHQPLQLSGLKEDVAPSHKIGEKIP